MNKSQAIVQVIPAQPGYFVLEPVWGDDTRAPVEWSQDPVIAWRVESDGPTTNWLIPIGIENSNYENNAVLCPDGQVRAFDRSWESTEQWFDYMRSQQAAFSRG